MLSTTQICAQNVQIFNFGLISDDVYSGDGIIDNDGNHVFLYKDAEGLEIVSLDEEYNDVFQNKIAPPHQLGKGRIIQLSNSKYFVALWATLGGKGTYMQVNASGGVDWNRKFVNSAACRDIIELEDGKIAMLTSLPTGSQIIILNGAGDITTSKQMYSDEVIYFVNKIIKTADGNIVLIGGSRVGGGFETKVHVVKMDYDCNIIWEKNYLTPNFDGFYSGLESVAGDFYFVGYSWASDGAPRQMTITRFDSEGNFLQAQKLNSAYDSRAFDIQQDEDQNLIVMGTTKPNAEAIGNLTLAKFNTSLGFMFSKTYGTTAGDESFFEVLHKKDNYFYAFGSGKNWLEFGSRDGHLIKFEKSLTLPCSEINEPLESVEVTAFPTMDSFVTYDDITNVIDEALPSVSVRGSQNTFYCLGGQIGVEEEIKIEPQISVYPNPLADELKISMSVSDLEGIQVMIYDNMGRLIFTVQPKSQNFSINFESFDKGVYLIKIEQEQEVFAKVIVKN